MTESFGIGDKFGGFTLIQRFPRGEFGETWLCENSITGRKGVLKGIRSDFESENPHLFHEFDLISRSYEEAKIVAALDDKGYDFVPRLYDAVVLEDSRVFYLMEYIEGVMLCDWLADQERAEQDRARIAFQLIRSVIYLHNVGIIHRDLSGDNIIINADNDVRIIDYGISKIKTELLLRKLSAKTVVPFTKCKYMPPIASVAIDAEEMPESGESWDLYALGILFLEIFAGISVSETGREYLEDMAKNTDCPTSIQMLLANGHDDRAPSGADIIKEFIGELRAAGHDAAFLHGDNGGVVAEALEKEIAQLKEDLRDRRGDTKFEDIARYLQRMELVYKVIPSKMTFIVEDLGDYLEGTEFIIESAQVEILMISTLRFRNIKSKRGELLRAINTFNWNSTIMKALYDPEDGEVRLRVCIAHSNSEIPYEEFSTQLAAMIKGANSLGKALDDVFASPQRAARLKRAVEPD